MKGRNREEEEKETICAYVHLQISRYNYNVLKTNLENTFKDLEDDTDLFIDLLCYMGKRFDALEAVKGAHTRF